MIPHPIPYQGSKRNLASEILTYFPDDIEYLIEPFAGSSAISIASAVHRKAKKYWLNDINESLMLLWHDIIHHPSKLSRLYTALWTKQLGHEKAFYNKVRHRFNVTQLPHYFLYLLARCVKASIRYNSNGEFNQSPDNRRKGRKPETMQRDIIAVSQLFKDKVRISSWDYREVLSFATPNDLIYMDPPYQGVNNVPDHRYVTGIQHEDFITVLDELNQRNISYILSYDGRTGKKTFGHRLPHNLNLHHIEIHAGRSSQATLLGRNEKTIESLYLSSALLGRLETFPIHQKPHQLSFLETLI